jgi:hypothetical protein
MVPFYSTPFKKKGTHPKTCLGIEGQQQPIIVFGEHIFQLLMRGVFISPAAATGAALVWQNAER